VRAIAVALAGAVLVVTGSPAVAGERVRPANVQFRQVLATLPPSTAGATAPLTNDAGLVESCDPAAVTAAVTAAASVPTSVRNRADQCVVLEQGAPGEGARLYLGPAMLDGDGVRRAVGGPTSSGQAAIDLRLTAAGKTAMNRFAADAFPLPPPLNQMAVVVDGRVVTAPAFQESTFPGAVQVSGPFSPREARTLGRRINVSQWLSRFCASSTTEAPEAFVGSDDHVAALRKIEQGPPSEVRPDLVRVRRYVEDHVDPADPDSQLVAEWPARVRAARDDLRVYSLEHCR
jgi:hypothetical protein